LTVSRGYDSTYESYHHKGADVICLGPNGNDVVVAVEDVSALNSPSAIYVGSELIDSISSIDDANNTITCNRTNSPYAHQTGVPVYTYTDASGTYSKTNPETDSSIEKYGLKSKPMIDRLATTKNDLDLRAYKILNAYKDPVKRVKVNAGKPITVLENAFLGDGVLLTDSQTGYSSESMRIVGFDLTWDKGVEKLELELSNEKLDYSLEFKEGIDEDTYKPVRNVSESFDDCFDDYSESGKTVLKQDLVVPQDRVIKGGPNIELLAGEGGDVIINAEGTGNAYPTLQINASTGSSSQVVISHDQTKGEIMVVTDDLPGDLQLSGDTLTFNVNTMEFLSDLEIKDGKHLYVYNSTNTHYVNIYHSGSYGYFKTDTDCAIRAIGHDVRLYAGDDIWLNASDKIFLDSSDEIEINPTIGRTWCTSDFRPGDTDVWDLGNSSYWWDNVHYANLISHSPRKIDIENPLQTIKDIDLSDKNTLPDFLIDLPTLEDIEIMKKREKLKGKPEKIREQLIKDGRVTGIKMDYVIYLLLEAVKELTAKVEKLESELDGR